MIKPNHNPNNSWGKPNPTVKREPSGSLFWFVSCSQTNKTYTQCVLNVYIAGTYISPYPYNNPYGKIGVRQEHKPRHLTERRIYIIPSSIYQLSATAVGSPTPTVGYHLFPRVTVWVTMPGYRRLPPGLPNLPDLPKIAPLGLPGIPSPSDRSV